MLTKRRISEYEMDPEDDISDNDWMFDRNEESDEDTEDASETDMVKQEEEYTEIKEQMYQDKLSNFKKQRKQLHEDIHPDYLKSVMKLEQKCQHRLTMIQIYERVEEERIEFDHKTEKESAYREFEEKKVEIRENLISDLEERRRTIENERTNMELMTDTTEVKPISTRKLRRRPTDPLPVPEKRRKTIPTQLNFLLDESDIMDDLRIINKTLSNKSGTTSKRHDSYEATPTEKATPIEVKVEDGKLYYDKKWYHRGQQVYYEGKDVGPKNSGLICTISQTEVWIKRTVDSLKIRIQLAQLQKGKFTLRRRSS